MLVQDFPASRFLDAASAQDILGRLWQLGIAGGAVYDVFVGAVAVQHRLPLATRDRRATSTYRALDVDIEMLA